MTRKEAKRVLEFDLDHTYNAESKEALRVVIELLEQESILDKIIAEISDLNCEYIEYGDDCCGCDAYVNQNDVLAIIHKYKEESGE